jgi:taspase (threonine aspartase 1)
MLALARGVDAKVGVVHALSFLEDNPATNAGYGSNLTWDGIVEGDATIIDHYGRPGAVAAVTSKLHSLCFQSYQTNS